MINIGNSNNWISIEDTQMNSRQECIEAVKDRIEKIEKYSLVDENHIKIDDEHEIAVTCSIHWPEEKPL